MFSQFLKLIPGREFETLAKQHRTGRSFQIDSRWLQFVTMMIAQLVGRNGLRDIVENISIQIHRLYYLGSSKLSRSNLSRINDGKPYTLDEVLFGKLLGRCQGMMPGNDFRFENPLYYSLDASAIDLYLSVFPWADFRTTKGAIELHVGLNHDGYLPEFVTVTEGRVHDVIVGRSLKLPKVSIVAIYRGYNDYTWYNQLTLNGMFFVARLKSNAQYRVIRRCMILANKRLTSDQMIEFTGGCSGRKKMSSLASPHLLSGPRNRQALRFPDQ